MAPDDPLMPPAGKLPDATPESPQPEVDLRQKRAKRRTVQFVLVFMITVLTLLSAYRYSINTLANDWYLFQVARHTTWLLDVVGYRATLEETFVEPKAREVRAKIAAWDAGLEQPTSEMIEAASEMPLSRWELYRHRIETSRHNPTRGPVGPRVSFILRPGVLVQVAEVRREIHELEQVQPRDESLLKTKRDSLAPLQAKRDTLLKDQENRADLVGKSFIFIVIPECGAIEIMVIFLAAVLGFPTTGRKRALGLLLGIPILYLVNVLRLSCLAMIGAFLGNGEWFDFAHNYVWQAIYIVFVVGVWLAWVEYVVRRKPAWKNENNAEA